MPTNTLQNQSQKQSGLLFDTYRPPSGVFDEAVTSGGTVRPAWSELVTHLNQMGNGELHNRWQQAQTQIQRDGVTFNPHVGSEDSRPWMLDAVPMVLGKAEWNGLAAQLCQRARVLDALVKDLLGKQRVLKDKIIPPELLFGHPAWYPAYQNLNQSRGRVLTYSATDIARSADGRWWATGDRTRSPFGLGYVLENRITTTRMLAGIFRQLPVCRLAGFYASLKKQLKSLAPRFRDNPRIALWTKGPGSRGYFEDSYLARYLGYTLAEGDDLAVRDNCVQLLTLGGLLPVEVLLRRVDDDDCDSVELNPDSQIGISGLLGVIRGGRVAVANRIGSRLVESPAFLPFLRNVSKYLLGEELQFPSVATWWCGDSQALAYVEQHLDQLLIRPAFRMEDVKPTVVAELSQADRQSLLAKIKATPEQFVGQEIVARSTTPVLTEEGVKPWFLGLRAYVAATDNGYEAMPGGLVRVSEDSNSLNFTMTAGERSQDLWILADEPVEQTSLLEPMTVQVEPKRSGSDLPSRVADNLFWLGRYSERAEQTARLLRTLFIQLESEDSGGPELAPLIRALTSQGMLPADTKPQDIQQTLTTALLDSKIGMSLKSSVQSVVNTTVRVRDRVSMEMWRTIDRLNNDVLEMGKVAPSNTVDMLMLLDNTLSSLSGFAGLAAEGMTRTLGWRFLDLGRRIERSSQIASLLSAFLSEHRSEDADTVEALLTVTDSLMTYRSRYLSMYQIPLVLDLLMTDTTNPRSILFQLKTIDHHLNAMPGSGERAVMAQEQHLTVAMTHQIQLANLYELSEFNAKQSRPGLTAVLEHLESNLPLLSDAIAGRFLIHAGLPRHFGVSKKEAALPELDS